MIGRRFAFDGVRSMADAGAAISDGVGDDEDAAEVSRIVAGCMTGTSLDGLDVALTRIVGTGLAMRAELIGLHSEPLDDLADVLRRIAASQAMSIGAMARAERELTLRHARAVERASRAAGERVGLIAAHGQTVHHAPPISVQLLDGALLAAESGVAVVCDLRSADLARGGQGAPITPIADAILFAHQAERRTVVNLGGFVNITGLPAGGVRPERIEAGDVCACNQLLDAIARDGLGAAYDDEGAAADSGSADAALHATLAAALSAQWESGRSLGSGDELAEAARAALGAQLPACDVARTACDAIAEVVARAVGETGRVILAGGGVRNARLVRSLRECVKPAIAVCLSDELGIPAQAREAVCIAVLGALCADGVAITLPRVTGVPAPAPVAGVWHGAEHPTSVR